MIVLSLRLRLTPALLPSAPARTPLCLSGQIQSSSPVPAAVVSCARFHATAWLGTDPPDSGPNPRFQLAACHRPIENLHQARPLSRSVVFGASSRTGSSQCGSARSRISHPPGIDPDAERLSRRPPVLRLRHPLGCA